MTARPWPPMLPCHKCGGRGHRNLGVQGWCERHCGELYATFPPHVWMSDEQLAAAQRKTDHDYVLQLPTDDLFGAIEDWADRLEWAIDTGTITRTEADHAWRLAVRYGAA